MPLWQLALLAALLGALIGTLLFATSLVVKKIGCTNATLRRIEEALVSANHRAAQSVVKAADTVSVSPSETFSSVATAGYLTVRDLKMVSGAPSATTGNSPVMHHDRRMNLQRRMELDRRNRLERRIHSERPAAIETSGETAERVDVAASDTAEVAAGPCVPAAVTDLAPVEPVTPVIPESPMVWVSPAAVSTVSISPAVLEFPTESELPVQSGPAMKSESSVPFETCGVLLRSAVSPVAPVGEELPTSFQPSQAAEPNGQRVPAVGLPARVEDAQAELENHKFDSRDLSSQPTALPSEDSVTVITDRDQPPSAHKDSLRPAGAVGEDAAAKRNQELYLMLSSQRRRRRARGG